MTTRTNIKVVTSFSTAMNVLVIGAGGTIGSTVAYTISVLRPNVDITLVDLRENVTVGHAIDIRHSTRHVTHNIGRPDFKNVNIGTITVSDPDPELVTEANCIVFAASAPRSVSDAQRGSRLMFLEDNYTIVDEIADWVRPAEPTPIVVISNPLDQITDRFWKQMKWPRSCFLGYSLSETARIADELARRFDTSPNRVYCPVLGEHGEYIVPAFSRATIDGEPLSLSQQDRQEIIEYACDAPYNVIELRGTEETSRWVSSRGVASLVVRVLEGGVEKPVCLSTPLEGEYSFEDICLSVPVTFSETGINEIIEWSLSESEWERFKAAEESVRDTIV